MREVRTGAVVLSVLTVLAIAVLAVLFAALGPKSGVPPDWYEPWPSGFKALHTFEETLSNGGPRTLITLLRHAEDRSDAAVARLVRHFQSKGFPRILREAPGAWQDARLDSDLGAVEIARWARFVPTLPDWSSMEPGSDWAKLAQEAARTSAPDRLVVVFVTAAR